MNNKSREKYDDILEIDLKRIWQAIWRRIWFVGIAAVLGAAIALAYTTYLVTPLYKSSTMFYVNNSALSFDGAEVDITTGDINASKSLVETYIVILNSRSCLNDVIDYADVNYTPEQLKNKLSAKAVNATEVFEVVITGPDPAEAEKIANAIAYILPNKISDIIEGTSAKVVDYAIVATSPSSPNKTSNTMIGFLAGLVLSVGFIIVLELLDNTIRSEDNVTQITSHPILAAVPDMAMHSKGGYYTKSEKVSKKKKRILDATDNSSETVLVGDGISFAATEAYKLLRTKLQFSFADEKNCHVIGVSSALAGEGKSLSSVNLGYSLAQLGKKVLLIDCDMRRPSLASKLNVARTPGLSNCLAGHIPVEDIIQTCSSDFQSAPFQVISAGRVPPNPIELLSSAKMKELLDFLKQHYDYIVLDLPPVGEVSDAIVAAKLVDGILMVVCQNYCSRGAFAHAVEQFEFVNARILGIVMNRISESGKGYYKYGKRYYRKYYNHYGYISKKETDEGNKDE